VRYTRIRFFYSSIILKLLPSYPLLVIFCFLKISLTHSHFLFSFRI